MSADRSRPLTLRALNRTLLLRQRLLERTTDGVALVLTHLVGMQAQVPASPYTALWSRIADFSPPLLAEPLVAREVVRTVLMRGTIHLVTAADCMELRPVFQEVMDRELRQNSWRDGLIGADLAAVAAAGRDALGDGALTPIQLGPLLEPLFPGNDPRGLAYAIRNLVPLVQVPPRGLWGKSGATRHAVASRWLGRDEVADGDVEGTLLRYLAAFGPATVSDMQAWSRVQALRPVVEGMRERLVVHRDERGKELFDVPGGEIADDVAAPVRFLPDYDNLFLSHADRTRIFPQGLATAGLIGKPAFLVDGMFAGSWSALREKGGLRRISVHPLRALTAPERRAVLAEAEELGSFLSDGGRVDLTVVPVP